PSSGSLNRATFTPSMHLPYLANDSKGSVGEQVCGSARIFARDRASNVLVVKAQTSLKLRYGK
ncbi:MAG: hypothetical protein WA571_14875, partial [Candidatus Binatus sp.]